MTKPLIGISCCNRDVGGENAQTVKDRYVKGVIEYADCLAVLIPAITTGFEAKTLTGKLDGLMLTGSTSNIDTRFYDPDTPAGEGPFDIDRDSVSFAMIEAMIDTQKPVFGICRGFQEINVALGGTLRRDLGPKHHAPDTVSFNDMFEFGHDVTLIDGGFFEERLGGNLWVNSVHFQGVARLADGLTMEAVAPDGIIEAFSANLGGSQVVAVQWHPEWRPKDYPDRQAFFQWLGQAARGEGVV
ncbi:gamma-glutamyl-gamma-aminobutyrate hydrolase family protein [Asticcacaulis sp. ZE23SCel15]|uniref:gamma-glutamyl-gamma-aminobutyrate hydrolase family protein n=1 Tax=Asticcacaulis sp. ZE23SCel15 TaxID=3059027 RepID=UPI00265F13AE|nr:gamma-glutamyl-gamma-aminobutyrate hydrolase family protein [Asticcacaulis sp. ZE23SCel15]WKL58789.1 gamma-glutamyl-gamma-aminobutyrate hydrolase family protein [Asticcacaulis sp. ZE23SCel15]